MKTKKTNGCRPEETGGQMVAKVLLKKARGLQEGQKEKARSKKGKGEGKKGPERRSREARKAERSQRPDVQERSERGLQEGYPPNQVQPLRGEGSLPGTAAKVP